jgi:adenine deaminase
MSDKDGNRMLTLEQLKSQIEASLGRRPLDLILQNVHLVNVYTGVIEQTSLGVFAGRIVTLNAAGLDSLQVYDGQGRLAIPGFIDTHVHIDSTLLTPEALSELITPHGTTAMFADPMESSNVAGLKGLEALLQSTAVLPYHLLVEVSSRVPTAPGLETTGGELGLEEVRRLLESENCISLGELDPSKVLGLRDEYLLKILAAHSLGKIANGHAAGLSGRELEAYICGGLADDHECVDYRDALLRLRSGMSVMIREGSTERNLDLIVNGVLQDGLDTRHLMFCTDDKHPDDILSEGHIDFMVNRAIELGLSPLQAIRMASLNAAEHFHLEGQLGSLGIGRWADVILCDDLHHIVPTQVFFQGRLVAENGSLTVPPVMGDYPEWFRHTVSVRRGKTAGDFVLSAPGPQASVRVIEIYPDQIINRRGEASLDVRQGNVAADPDRDLLKLAVVERYGKNGNIGISFVRGFGLKRGALASTVSHDHHNIVVVGADELSMAACVRAAEAMEGGLVVALGDEVLGTLPLPLGGLMSERWSDEVIASLAEITAFAHELGCLLPAPFMTLSFISLPTVPELGLTDLGLVDVREHKIISPFADH